MPNSVHEVRDGNNRTRLGYLGFAVVGLTTAFGFEILASALDPKNATFKNLVNV